MCMWRMPTLAHVSGISDAWLIKPFYLMHPYAADYWTLQVKIGDVRNTHPTLSSTHLTWRKTQRQGCPPSPLSSARVVRTPAMLCQTSMPGRCAHKMGMIFQNTFNDGIPPQNHRNSNNNLGCLAYHGISCHDLSGLGGHPCSVLQPPKSARIWDASSQTGITCFKPPIR